MPKHGRAVCVALLAVSSGFPAAAQPPGRRMMAMRHDSTMMAMQHDSTTMVEMRVIHDLVRNHDRITRSVTNLPDGIRTVTESADSAIAQRIKQHVAAMSVRVAAGDDPGLPMESPALQAIYKNGALIRTTIDTTATGIAITQTSTDSATVAALQQHAAEVTELVRRGMAAMHDAMMKRR